MREAHMESLLPRLLGNETRFVHECWRKRTHMEKGALPELAGWYGCGQFLADYRRLAPHDVSLIASVEADQTRQMRRPVNQEEVEATLSRGGSLVVQALLAPDVVTLPEAWSWFHSLYTGLCRHFLPGFSLQGSTGGTVAAIDIFCTTQRGASIGGHYDTGDVFYFVLDGKKEWTVELVPDPVTAHELTARGANYTHDRQPKHECMQLCVEPGDCLYVPPYTYHRVASEGHSLAVSLGLPSFTEVSLLCQLLARIQQDELLYTPLPSFPLTDMALAQSADTEKRVRSSRLLERLSALLSQSGTLDSSS